MIMQISPRSTSCPETLRTLRFGERCQAVCLGAVKRGGSTNGKGGNSGKQAEAAAKAAEAAEERSSRLQSELIETRKTAKEAEERRGTAEARAEATA